MASVNGVPSPESTVTSLLATSGRLRSSRHPEPLHTIKYKDRNYESASDALNAYIDDFQSSVTSVGQLELPKQQNTPHLHSGSRNRDVLKASLTDQELDVLNLPTPSKRRESDHISMTTDDLLLLPVDGSLPVTRTSAFLSRLEGSRLENSTYSSVWSRSKSVEGPDKSLNCSSASRTMCVDDLLIGSLKLKHASLQTNSSLSAKVKRQCYVSSHHLPRWMTSRKSEMEFSGLTSIPDLKYPVWLEDYDDNVGDVPAWVSKLQPNTDKTYGKLKGQERLIGQTGDNGRPFRDDKIGSLIQRAEDVLNSPSLGFYGSNKEQHGSPGNTEELLEAERLWDNPPVTFKSPVPVGCTDEQITAEELQIDTKEQCPDSLSSGYSSRKHPGPVEALKQMLFSLQAVEQRVTQQKDETHNITSQPVANPTIQTENHDNDVATQPGIEDYDSVPGGQSLKRALHHLGRLKNLVDDMNERRSVDWKEGGV